jgi:REP element-mobilizing transposase RayT
MPIRTNHIITDRTWFITFTCYNWLPLFDITQSYDLVYKWLALINNKYGIKTLGFVIMPNHLHLLLYLGDDTINLNALISNAKRFMAYDIVERLKKTNSNMLYTLSMACSEKELKKGQKHKVFEPSFDAKVIYSRDFLLQKLNYIHGNPVSKKWMLCDVFTDYEHSSAGFYESGQPHAHIDVINYAEYWC